MGIASELTEALMAHPLTPDEIHKRLAAQTRHANLVATTDGELVDPAPTPTQGPSVVSTSPQRTWD